MGRRPPCSGDDHHKEDGTMKKGAWTAEEDEKLLGFIKKNKGHGSWRTLPKLAGLERCGKSCRLRWANYLRPNIKRGNFSAEEEGIIVQFHAVMGNKWSTIASHLPGRTDNEVKNHWNTHLKKRLTRMGIDPTTHLPFNLLPVPPRHLHNDASTIADWQQALLQHSLQVNSTIARHLVQWELARLEAEARQQLASSDDYYASWLQKLYRKQSPVYDLHALLTVENLQTELVTSQPITTVSSYTQSHGSQTSDTKHLENTPRPLSGGDDMSLKMNNVENIERASFSNEESELLQEQCVLTSASGGSTGALDTCSSSDSLPNHLSSSQFDVPDDFLALDLSSDDSYDPDIIADPLENSSLSLDDIPAGQQDSYWSRMLNFLDHVSLENL